MYLRCDGMHENGKFMLEMGLVVDSFLIIVWIEPDKNKLMWKRFEFFISYDFVVFIYATMCEFVRLDR